MNGITISRILAQIMTSSLAQIYRKANSMVFISVKKILVCERLPFTQEALKNIACSSMNLDSNYYMQSEQSMFDAHK